MGTVPTIHVVLVVHLCFVAAFMGLFLCEAVAEGYGSKNELHPIGIRMHSDAFSINPTYKRQSATEIATHRRQIRKELASLFQRATSQNNSELFSGTQSIP